MNDCFYCENGEKLNSLMIEVCKLDYSTVYLNRDQKHKGRCIVMFKDHKTEYFQLTEEENRGYFAELAKTAQAVWNLYHPDKINYATFGDGVPHVHVHVVPKYKGGLQWGEAFHDDVEKVLLSEEEYQEMAKALREELCKPWLSYTSDAADEEDRGDIGGRSGNNLRSRTKNQGQDE